jgi:CRISPR-associated protein Cas1
MPSVNNIRAFIDESHRYSSLTDEVMSSSDVVVLSGHKCGLRIWNGALHINQGSLPGLKREPITCFKGTTPFRTIVILSRSGSITLDAFHWCKEQDISLLMLNGNGTPVYSLAPESESNAKLRRCQYQAGDTGMAGFISRELVRRKTLAQIDTLKMLPTREQEQSFIHFAGMRIPVKDDLGRLPGESLWKLLEDGLVELSHMSEIETIRTLEGRLAYHYWNAFVGLPINWRPSDEKIVPPHWKVITERMDSGSGTGSRRTKSPFHAALNYLYGVAEHLLSCAVQSAGLDPSCGFLHADKEHRPSLIFDLIEPHRAVIDAKVLEFFRQTTMRIGDVTLMPSGQVVLNKELCRFLIVKCLPDGRRLGDTVQWLVSTLTGS